MISYDSSTGSSGTPKRSAVVTFLGVVSRLNAVKLEEAKVDV
jgi:hypothetical protein